MANGSAWHDRLPNKLFDKTEPDGFAPASQIVDYLVEYAEELDAPPLPPGALPFKREIA
ncbi:hypothetical protein [Acidocella aromatica]|uniref:Uncharacterized protein n=1 Tax=Acidocella aromatica TaxID=1303579 RepID=A0A840VWE0_9PROT|nr:hypothetical protein [Acidocella aromatica]MBB5374442.1 hypothetical protein [Acidocella aromatica]